MGLALTYLIALHTAGGLTHDLSLYQRASGNEAVPVKAAGERALRTIDVGSTAVALVAIVAVGLARRSFARAAASVVSVACSIGTAELLKHVLPRLPHGIPPGRPPTWPSGHTSVAVSLGLALVLAAPSVLRPTAAVVGAAYGAGIGLSVIVLGWHYPSDVVGSFFICGFWACAAAAFLSGTVDRPSVSRGGLATAIVAVAAGLVMAAVLAGRHPGAVVAVHTSRSVVATAAGLGLLSVVLFAMYTPLVEERRE